jgi:deoxyadenosine/deoxycytidine kinase
MSSQQSTRPYIICIEGGIGSGKTTLLRSLETALPHAAIFEEHVDDFHSQLADFYADPPRHAFRLQIKVSLVHRDTQRRVLECGRPLAIVERSPLSNQWVFGHMLWKDGILTGSEWSDLCHAHEHYSWQPDAYILLDTPAAICHERKCKRARNGEDPITIDYMHSLEAAHNRVFKGTDANTRRGTSPVFIIDGDTSADAVLAQAVDAISQLK